MKWHKNLYEEINTALENIFDKHQQADKYIHYLLKKHKKWGSRDRKFVAKVLYDIVRWKRYYEYLSESDITTSTGKNRILSIWTLLNNVELPPYLFFEDLTMEKITRLDKKLNNPAIRYSLPDWLYHTGVQQLGETVWNKELEALNKEADVVIRVNTLRTAKETVKKILQRKNIIFGEHEDYPDALFLKTRKKLTALQAYKKGFFEIQDASSQLVAPFTGVKPGMTVIDACAGAGGKTLHLATLMKNTGKIYAYDIYASKIEELRKRASRNQVKNIVEAGIINTETIKKNEDKADILLLDAPCSSLGTLKRKPGLKWQLSQEKLRQINVIQRDIMENYEKMLKPGGTLIYVTCSILPQENKEIVNNFLKKYKNYTFVSEKNIFPSQARGDGFYMAKLIKNK